MTAIARHATVHGRVQGVGFRYAAQRRAAAAGVRGWVRNTPEGTVEAWLEGAPDDVAVVLDFLGRGPPGAGVTRVDVGEREPEGPAGFEIR